MNARLVGDGFGRTVAIEGPAKAIDAARLVLPFWWEPSVGHPECVFYAGTEEMAPHVVRAMELWIAEHAVDLLFIHAAAVAVDGRAIVLPGRSQTGKTTLCVELLKGGAEYLSDEYVVLDSSGLVHAYPRPLHVRVSGQRRPTSPESLGAAVSAHPVPIGLVATLSYSDGASWSVEPAQRAMGVLSMLDNAVAAQSRSAEVLSTVEPALRGARCVEGERGPAADAVGPLLASLRASGRRT